MAERMFVLPHRVKLALRREARKSRDAGFRDRCRIVLRAGRQWSSRRIADALGVSRSWVSRVIRRFDEQGIVGLADHREDNGTVKVDDWYLKELEEVVGGSPQDYGYSRPTWTRELLIRVLEERTGVRIHPGTMSRALKRIGARRGTPRPTVNCPWPRSRKNRRLREIRKIVNDASPEDEVVYEDEVDIHLNPKIGLDWMNRGQQKEVVTPGKNEKRYLAGALNARTGRLTYVESRMKNSVLFVMFLRELLRAYPKARAIHVILDNYSIHHSRTTQLALRYFAKRIRLHFLPPYCPQHNKIERVWQDLHAEVTRNHRHRTMDSLMGAVRNYLRKRNQGKQIRTFVNAA